MSDASKNENPTVTVSVAEYQKLQAAPLAVLRPGRDGLPGSCHPAGRARRGVHRSGGADRRRVCRGSPRGDRGRHHDVVPGPAAEHVTKFLEAAPLGAVSEDGRAGAAGCTHHARDRSGVGVQGQLNPVGEV